MRMTYAFLFFLVVLLPTVSSMAANERNASIQTQIGQISKDLSESRIGRVEILHIPPRVLTRARITPEMLEKQYYVKFIIRDINSNSYKDKLVSSFMSISVSPRDDTPDLRWAVIFYSRDETRVGAIYFDKSGQYGAVNGVGAAFRGNFFSWLTATFSHCFE